MTLKKRFENWFFSLPPYILALMPGEVVYVRISSNELHLRGADSQKEWRDYPALAATAPRPYREVVAIGKEAIDAVALNSELELLEPFKHPRSIISDFDAGQELLRSTLRVLNKRLFFTPVLVLHPLEQLEGGLTQIEERALLELAAAAGARRGCLWTGRQLTDEDLRTALRSKTEWLDIKQ